MKKRSSIILLVLLLIIGLVYLQSRRSVGNFRQSVSLTFKAPQAMMSPDMLTIIAGEFNGILADYMLLEAGSFFGSGQKMSKSDYRNIYLTLKQVLALDPYFQQTYLIAQGVLPWKAQMVDETIELLDISRQHRPWDWRPGSYIGFDYYFFKNDYAKASEALLEAAKTKRAPVILAILGARMATKGQRIEAAMVMLKKILKEEELSESDRKDIEERLLALNGVLLLEKAVDRYKAQTQHLPSNLDTLVENHYIVAMPPNPYADHYFYDPESGVVRFDQVK